MAFSKQISVSNPTVLPMMEGKNKNNNDPEPVSTGEPVADICSYLHAPVTLREEAYHFLRIGIGNLLFKGWKRLNNTQFERKVNAFYASPRPIDRFTRRYLDVFSVRQQVFLNTDIIEHPPAFTPRRSDPPAIPLMAPLALELSLIQSVLHGGSLQLESNLLESLTSGGEYAAGSGLNLGLVTSFLIILSFISSNQISAHTAARSRLLTTFCRLLEQEKSAIEQRLKQEPETPDLRQTRDTLSTCIKIVKAGQRQQYVNGTMDGTLPTVAAFGAVAATFHPVVFAGAAVLNSVIALARSTRQIVALAMNRRVRLPRARSQDASAVSAGRNHLRQYKKQRLKGLLLSLPGHFSITAGTVCFAVGAVFLAASAAFPPVLFGVSVGLVGSGVAWRMWNTRQYGQVMQSMIRTDLFHYPMTDDQRLMLTDYLTRTRQHIDRFAAQLNHKRPPLKALSIAGLRAGYGLVRFLALGSRFEWMERLSRQVQHEALRSHPELDTQLARCVIDQVRLTRSFLADANVPGIRSLLLPGLHQEQQRKPYPCEAAVCDQALKHLAGLPFDSPVDRLQLIFGWLRLSGHETTVLGNLIKGLGEGQVSPHGSLSIEPAEPLAIDLPEICEPGNDTELAAFNYQSLLHTIHTTGLAPKSFRIHFNPDRLIRDYQKGDAGADTLMTLFFEHVSLVLTREFYEENRHLNHALYTYLLTDASRESGHPDARRLSG